MAVPSGPVMRQDPSIPYCPFALTSGPRRIKATDVFVALNSALRHLQLFERLSLLLCFGGRCGQCEQTFENKGCTTVGVCGKTPAVAGLQVSSVSKGSRHSTKLSSVATSCMWGSPMLHTVYVACHQP
jgi:hypothetical protein